MKSKFLLFLFFHFPIMNLSFSNDAILKEFETQAKSNDVKFTSFSITEGEKFFEQRE